MATGECRDVDPEITGTCPVRAFMEGLIGPLALILSPIRRAMTM